MLKSRLPMILVLADQALISGTRLLSQVAIARYAFPEGLGVGFYVSTFGMVVLAVMFSESFITTPINVFLPHQPLSDRPRLLVGGWLSLWRLVGVAFLLAVLVALTCRFLQGRWPSAAIAFPVGERIAWVLAWYLPLHLAREFGRRWLLAIREQTRLIKLDGLASGLLLAGLGISVVWLRVDSIVVLGLTTVANFIFVGLWWRQTLQGQSLPWAALGEFGKLARGYGRWVAAEGIFGVLLVYFSQWYITSKLGEAASDRFGACLTLVFVANPFLLGVTSFFSPKAAQDFAEHGWPGLKRSTLSFSILVSCVLVSVTAVIYFGGDQLLSKVFGDKYDGLGQTISILSLGMVFMGLGYLFATTLQAAKAPQLNFLASLVSGTGVVLYTVWFVQDDLSPAAYSFLWSSILGMVIRLGGIIWISRPSETPKANGNRSH